MKFSAYFNPGPSQLYFTVQDHMRAAMRENIPSISHRSKAFESIYESCVSWLRELLDVPQSYHIVFTSSATEAWERIIQNLVIEKSHHLVNGSFSKKFYEIAQQLGRNPSKTEVPDGNGFNPIDIGDTELIAVTHNETSTGVSLPLDFIHQFKLSNPGALITVDAVSSLPYPLFDYSKLDSVYFSVQKGFGLPAGLGVWIVNDRCVAKADDILSKGRSIGSYHALPNLVKLTKKNQTPETPNVLGIFLLSRVVKDMLRRGINTIRKETEYKSAILYAALNTHGRMKPFVSDPKFQSKTVIVADCGDNRSEIEEKLVQRHLVPGSGYGAHKDNHLRFANFPAHSKEQFELLVDTLNEI